MNLLQWLEQNADEDDVVPGATYDRDSGVRFGAQPVARSDIGRWRIADEDKLLAFIEAS